jgi:hypothetical protein
MRAPDLQQRHFATLRGLRLNCWLAPLSVAAIAAALLIAVHVDDAAAAEAAARGQTAAALAAYADLDRAASRPALARWLHADPRWTCLAEICAKGDRLAVTAHAGADPHIDLDAPPAQVIDAVEQARCWDAGAGRWCAAAPMRDANGIVGSVLYGETSASAPLPGSVTGAALTALIVVAMSLAWYLVRRIYQPLEFLERQARAALTGATDGPGPVSAETAALRSSITALAHRYRAVVPPAPEGAP